MTDKQPESITTLFRYIFYAFFQPARLKREFQPASLQQRFDFMPKIVVLMFLVSYPLTLAGEAVLLHFSLLKYADYRSILVIPIAGIVFAIACGMTGVVRGDVGSGIAFGIVFGVASGVGNAMVEGVASSIVFGIVGGMAFGIAEALVGAIVGVILGVILGVTMAGTGVGIALGMAGVIGVVLGHYRLPLYLVSGPSSLYAYLASWQRPRKALQLLRHSSLYWDERVYLPLPFLKQTLLIASGQDLQEAVAEIAFIAAERPQQLRAARAALLEIAIRDLEERKTIKQIAGAAQRLNELLPPETKLSDTRWLKALSWLSDASREMMRSMQPIGRQARLKSLNRMRENLNKIRPNVAFSDQGLNRRLKQVIETWLEASLQESERIKRAVQDIGSIDNPYKVGQVLELNDPLFVGRRDLAAQLENALSKGNRRPTLLLQGERRMGKTSTLYQLSHLLGSSYVPLVYNLQDPKLYARIGTLLGTFANGIYDELLNRGIKVKDVPAERLREARSDPKAYEIFDSWLKGVEVVLKEEERSLLFAFDEFEKLDEAGEKGYMDLSLFLDWCRQVIQYRPHIILLFSGVRTFSDMGAKSGLNWSSYFVNVQTLKVSFLNGDEAHQLILHPRPDYPGEEIFGAVVEEIIQRTNCHPFLVQALCSQLIDTLNVEKHAQVRSTNMERAVKQVIKSWDGYFDDLWKRCDKSQRTCLLVLEKGEEEMTLNTIQQRSQLDEKSVRQALRTLISRDLVVDNDDGTYSIAAPIFRKWVKYNS